MPMPVSLAPVVSHSLRSGTAAGEGPFPRRSSGGPGGGFAAGGWAVPSSQGLLLIFRLFNNHKTQKYFAGVLVCGSSFLWWCFTQWK